MKRTITNFLCVICVSLSHFSRWSSRSDSFSFFPWCPLELSLVAVISRKQSVIPQRSMIRSISKFVGGQYSLSTIIFIVLLMKSARRENMTWIYRGSQKTNRFHTVIIYSNIYFCFLVPARDSVDAYIFYFN